MSDPSVKDQIQIGSLTFVRRTYGDLDVEWVNRTQDHWTSDTDMSETISHEDAQKLFNMLWEYLAP